jgi:uncharacterized protein
MPLIFNLRHLDSHDLSLKGELPAAEMDLAGVDDMVELSEPVQYDLVAERLSESVLVQGRLQCHLACQCVRCLRPFTVGLDLKNWTCDLRLEGEDKVTVTNDCVDLTPYLREDILLAFPQHPLCEPDCRGLPDAEDNLNRSASVDEQASEGSSAWAELNKLKF